MRTQTLIFKSIIRLLIIASFSYFVACEKDTDSPEGNNKIEFSQPEADSISYYWADFTGIISSNDIQYNYIDDHGFCWSTTPNPDISLSFKSLGNMQSQNNFSARVDGLVNNTRYYLRAYAKLKSGVSYSPITEFTTLPTRIPVVSLDDIYDVHENTAICISQVIDDGGEPITARGVCWGNSPNPTLGNSHTTQDSGIGSFTSTLTELNINTYYYVRSYATNSIGTAYGNELNFKTDICNLDITLTHMEGDIAPITKTVNYTTVRTELTGTSKCWLTQNLGSDHQASSANDATEASAGWYWQFNQKQGYKHDGITRTPGVTWITSIIGNSDWLPANDPCTLLLGNGWRMPTKAEWETADASMGWDNHNKTFNSVLKLHAAGSLNNSSGLLNSRGSIGDYWSSSQGSLDKGQYLTFFNTYCHMNSNSKAYGFSLRCLRD